MSTECDYYQLVLNKLYGYDLNPKPKCCDNVISFCTTEQKVVKIYMPDYKLGGFLPSEVGKLSSLKELYLQNNQLKGEISAIGSLSTLTNLNLSNNKLSATIPATLSNNKDLVDLFLQKNDFTGLVPKEIGNLSKLKQLDVSGNMLDGDLAFVSKVPDSSYTFGEQRKPPAKAPFTGSPVATSTLIIVISSVVVLFVGVIIFVLFKFRQSKKLGIKYGYEDYGPEPDTLSTHTTDSVQYDYNVDGETDNEDEPKIEKV